MLTEPFSAGSDAVPINIFKRSYSNPGFWSYNLKVYN